MTSSVKLALERSTKESWTVVERPTDVFFRCKHGMRIWVPYPNQNKYQEPFLTKDAEDTFVRKVLANHARDYYQ